MWKNFLLLANSFVKAGFKMGALPLFYDQIQVI